MKKTFYDAKLEEVTQLKHLALQQQKFKEIAAYIAREQTINQIIGKVHEELGELHHAFGKLSLWGPFSCHPASDKTNITRVQDEFADVLAIIYYFANHVTEFNIAHIESRIVDKTKVFEELFGLPLLYEEPEDYPKPSDNNDCPF